MELTGIHNGYRWVDLGLKIQQDGHWMKVLFATKNFGADTPLDTGTYYQWGSVVKRYKDSPTEYNWVQENAPKSFADVAADCWSRGWRIPTTDEFRLLLDGNLVEFQYVAYYKGTNVDGMLFTGRKTYAKAELFFPATGYYSGREFKRHEVACSYWTSNGDNRIYEADTFGYVSGVGEIFHNESTWRGRCIRPVITVPLYSLPL